MGVFSRFLNCTNGTKSRKASHIDSDLDTNTYIDLYTEIGWQLITTNQNSQKG